MADATLTSNLDRYPPVTVDARRGDLVESRHVVYGCVWGDAKGRPHGSVRAAWGDDALMTYMRSALKPFQSLPLVLDGVVERYGLTEEELAVTIGSHSGQPVHTELVASLLEKAGIDKATLKTGVHRPFHRDTQLAVGGDATTLHNNCSGKHAGMLAWAKLHDEPLEDYRDPDHAVQRRILELVAILTHIPQRDLVLGVDGCGVPTIGMPLWAMARLFHILARPELVREKPVSDSLDEAEQERLVAAIRTVRQAMARHPLLVAGEGRTDTDVIQATKGRWVTKAGAEGAWCGVDLETGEAFAFKAVDGEFRAVVPATLQVMAARGNLSKPEVEALAKWLRPVLKNHPGDVVGELRTQVPHGQAHEHAH